MFYDVRKDADALYNIYNIDMQNVLDVQITELAVRKSNRQFHRHLNGLAKAISSYLHPGPEWMRVKERGQMLMNPQHIGGSYEAFEQRLLPRSLVEYAAQDVALLADLKETLTRRIGRQVRGRESWGRRVGVASALRVEESKGGYEPDGPHRALSPQI
ncbi:hypothetical protein NMY22_g2702 [Coprinellus aureogranulatus]|nr:hypothetical protein NMY22_g2702 [Coprinellus aureogranulatus]